MIFLGAILLALGLNALIPFTFDRPSWAVTAGWGVAVFGFLFAIFSMANFAKAFRKKGVWDPDRLVTSGLSKLSRNPFYLGVVIAVLGSGLARGNAWVLLAGVLIFGLIDRLVIPFEEAMLTEKFGDQYRDYKKKVRRWL